MSHIFFNIFQIVCVDIQVLFAVLDILAELFVGKAFTVAAKAAGFDGFTFHGLRHTRAATLMLSGGIDVKLAASRLGHANPTVTMMVYQRVQPDLVRNEAIGRLDVDGAVRGAREIEVERKGEDALCRLIQRGVRRRCRRRPGAGSRQAARGRIGRCDIGRIAR